MTITFFILQLFLPPSPTNTSSFSCSPGLECHMMLYLRRGYNDIWLASKFQFNYCLECFLTTNITKLVCSETR